MPRSIWREAKRGFTRYGERECPDWGTPFLLLKENRLPKKAVYYKCSKKLVEISGIEPLTS